MLMIVVYTFNFKLSGLQYLKNIRSGKYPKSITANIDVYQEDIFGKFYNEY